MKTTFPAIAILFCLAFISCKKEKNNTIYKVTYSVTGDNVNQFKITVGSSDVLEEVPFSGARDTSVFVAAGTNLKLDTKADNNNLVGTISVNDVVKATATDTDVDGDGKTQVKLDYTLPNQ